MKLIAMRARRLLVPAAWSAWTFGRWSYRRTADGQIERRGLAGPWVVVPARDLPVLLY